MLTHDRLLGALPLNRIRHFMTRGVIVLTPCR
ncbi:hypothetical protein EDD93_3890 [Streptomyces sp. 840.1]|nr:hypothetical protein EDD93_3890 [Streptomyces sp. 840.1]